MYTQGSPILPIGNIQQFQSAENTKSDCSICILSDLNVWTSNGVGIFASVHDFQKTVHFLRSLPSKRVNI